ncbi:MAG: DUF1592 domain-containing protein [Sandaracinus sp.]|nr:DUF1592 domain-containing protein [Sandaracinus sp.]
MSSFESVMRRGLVSLTCVLLACSGTIGAAGGSDPDDPRRPGEDPEVEIPEGGANLHRLLEPSERCEDDTMPRAVRRLTGRQYRNSLLAIFGGDVSLPDGDVLDDPVVHGFSVDADAAVVRDLGAQRLMQHAERVATWAVESKLALFTTCRDLSDACRTEFLDRFGSAAFRAPLTDAQRNAYDGLMREEATFEAGAEVVMTAMLQSPFFLYRHELGGERRDGRRSLTPFERASALSYLVIEGPPDEALRAAALEGRLETEEDMVRELDRLLDTPAAEEMLTHFVHGWLEVDDLPGKVKDDTGFVLTPELRASMLDETARFFTDLVRNEGTFEELFSARHTMVDARLRELYGLSGEGQVSIEGSRRGPGVLGQGAVLARHALASSSSPVSRGLLIRERVLCQELPDPPPGVNTDLEGVGSPVTTTRERYNEHSRNEACSGCHRLMDPIGFAFEHYDAYGRWRDDENGHAIDTSGQIEGLPDGTDVPLDGLESLAEALANDPSARDCYARHFAYFAQGTPGCGETVRAMADTPEGSLRGMLRSLVTTRQFLQRVD